MSRRSWQNDAEEFQRLRDALKQSARRAQAMGRPERITGPSSASLSGSPSTNEALNRMVTLLFKAEPCAS